MICIAGGCRICIAGGCRICIAGVDVLISRLGRDDVMDLAMWIQQCGASQCRAQGVVAPPVSASG